jgi:uncharacterized membrane protein
MFIGFLVGGLALPIGPNWIMFWTGVGIVIVGGILAMIFDIVSDVVVAQPYVSRDPAKRAADAARAAELRAARQKQAASERVASGETAESH